MGGKKMHKSIKTFIAVAALSGTVGANIVHAEEITVKKGDTLWVLSKVHKTSVKKLKEWNHLSTDLIHPGDKLTIADEKHYVVKRGDTLLAISKQYHVTVEQIMEWNTLKSDLIHPGLNLVIYKGQNFAASAGQTGQVKSESSTVSVAGQVHSEITSKAEVAAKHEVKPSVVSNTRARVFTVTATAYTASCGGCSGITATGINIKANPNAKVISVDPSIIPLGSKVYVEGYGMAIAADTGGAIKGNRIDVFIPSKKEALNFGVKQLKVRILN
jgi:3D (Asp-Asp-Asp) domain-containing protein/LysM repeat protein